MKFHHIGIATDDIDKMISKMKKYFKIENITEIVYDSNQNANVCMLTLESWGDYD